MKITFSVLFATTVLSGAFLYKTNEKAKEINLEAFKNLKENISFIAENKSENISTDSNEEITGKIITVIDREIKAEIKKTKTAIFTIKPKKKIALENINDEVKTTTAAAIKLDFPEIKKEQKIEEKEYSEYIINNSNLINLYAFNVEPKSTEVLSEIEIAEIETPANEETLKDEVATSQASSAEVASSVSLADDELTVFDYSEQKEQIAEETKVEAKKEKTINEKLYERPISSSVKNAITRAIGSAPTKAIEEKQMDIQTPPVDKKDLVEPEIDLNSPENTVYDYSNDKKSSTDRSPSEIIKNAFSAPVLNQKRFILRSKELNMSTHTMKQKYSFEFIPDYDRAERLDDQSSGEIIFDYSLAGSMNTQTGVVQSRGMISTRVELNLNTMSGLEIPMLNEDALQEFLISEKIESTGNLLMVNLNNNIEDTEIDSSYSHKILLNQKLKITQERSDAKYVLFLGVKTGNVLLKFLLTNKETAQKIIFVGEGELYFEEGSLVQSVRDVYSLSTRPLLANKKRELIINAEDFSVFNSKITSKKKALNAYEIKIPTQINGMRKYFELKHLEAPLFIGTQVETNLEIPGNDFIKNVLRSLQIESLKNQCIVQVNLAKELREVKVSGKNSNGEMFVETNYLDQEGGFSAENFELAEKLFITGDQEGQIGVRLDYTDGSSEFVKTFCSQGSYLVEQL